MYEHNALGYWSGLALCLTKVRSSRARCPATALIIIIIYTFFVLKFAFGMACICQSSDYHICQMTYILSFDRKSVETIFLDLMIIPLGYPC